MEALNFFRNNKNKYCFASNHFDNTKVAFKFVQTLYSLGAIHIEVDNISDEPTRIKSEGGPYADVLLVHLPKNTAKHKQIMLAIGYERPDEFDEEKHNVLRLWWD